MKKTPDVSDEDKALFRESMRDIQVLKTNKVSLKPKTKKIIFKPVITTSKIRATPSFTEPLPEMTVNAEDVLFFTRPGLQTKRLQRFKRGLIPYEAKLDLHGLTAAQAKQALTRFLQRGYRCILIIHGKGYSSQQCKPILKNYLNHWLQLLPEVLAFCTAQRQHGGAGAVYVLLKEL